MLRIEIKLKYFSFGFFHVISCGLKDLIQVGINASTGTRWLLTQTQKHIHRLILEVLAQGFCFCAMNVESNFCAQSRRPC